MGVCRDQQCSRPSTATESPCAAGGAEGGREGGREGGGGGGNEGRRE